MTLPDRIRFHAQTLRSSLDILIRAAGLPRSTDGPDEADAGFLNAETPLAVEDAQEALAALESLAASLSGAEDTGQTAQADYREVRRS